MAVKVSRSIEDLETVIRGLPAEKREIFNRIFRVKTLEASCSLPPPPMHPWLVERFGSLEGVTCQRIVKITNLVTWEGAAFNPLRAFRPLPRREHLHLKTKVLDDGRDDPLKDPEKTTPEEPFGRVRGKHCITAANIAKYDVLHGIIVFNTYDPLDFDEEKLADYIDTALRWADLAHRHYPESKHFLLIWNCLWRAGASLHHGHMQVMLSPEPFTKLAALYQASRLYKEKYGSDYFDDLFTAHLMVGAALQKGGVRVLAYLTPVKEKEVMLIAPQIDDNFKQTLYQILVCFRDHLGVFSFNLMLTAPPLEEGWQGFPVLSRLVDRGDPRIIASDVGAMELYAHSIISSDPLKLAAELKSFVGNNPPGL